MQPIKIIIISTIIFLFFAGGALAQVITLDSSTHYQTWQRWTATTYMCDWPGQCSNSWPGYPSSPPAWLSSAMSQAVAVGLTGITLEISSGYENATDWWNELITGHINASTYTNTYAYSIINDNADPQVINPSGFGWGAIDERMKNIVIPFKNAVEASGQTFWWNVKYVDFPRAARSFNHYDNPQEYAEYILAIWNHLNITYGFVPDALDVINEPDNITYAPGWANGTTIANIIKVTGDRLTAVGYNPKFIVSSAANLAHAAIYFDAIKTRLDSIGGFSYIKEISYHYYGGYSIANLQAIGTRALNNNLISNLTESLPWATDYAVLHEEIKNSRLAAWDGTYNLLRPIDGSACWLWVNDSTGVVSLSNDPLQWIQLYSKFIRPGAVRIAASSDNANFDPIAFINSNGKYVVVVKAALAGQFSVQSLPAGTYGIKYTTASQYDKDLTDVVLQPDQTLTTNIPAAGVITVYAKSAVPPDTTPPAAPIGVAVS